MATLAIGTETIPADPVVGQEFYYLIHVVNLGPDRATNVVVTDLLSDLVDPSFEPSGCSRQGRLVTCSPIDIEPGGQRIVNILVRARTPATPVLNAAGARGTNTNVATVLHLAFPRQPPNLVQYFMPGST